MDSTQVLINSLATANSVEELRNRLIPLLTRVAEAAQSEGITSITSDSLDVTTPSVGVRNIEGIGTDFVPAPSNVTAGATIDISSGFYYRVGDFVTMTFGFDVQLAIGQLSTTFNFSLPIASNFTNARQMIVTCNSLTVLASLLGTSDSTENKGILTVSGTAVGVAVQSLQVSATYQILP